MNAVPVEAWQYGVLGVIAIVFAYGIITLWKHGNAREERATAEREIWVKREAEIRAECEAKIAAKAEAYAQALRDEHAECREYQDSIRGQYAEMLDQHSTRSAEAARAIGTALEKIHDRFLDRPPARR